MWTKPIPLRLVATAESVSYREFDFGTTGLPIGTHPGAYGVLRKNHVHEGVDLYCPEGTAVHAVEAGRVVAVLAFTGPAASMPWWLDTQAVLVEGDTGVVLYGEVNPLVNVGRVVHAGEQIATVMRVLRNDKGRPTSMLHLELHAAGARAAPEWTLASGMPSTLRDPTPFLLDCVIS